MHDMSAAQAPPRPLNHGYGQQSEIRMSFTLSSSRSSRNGRPLAVERRPDAFARKPEASSPDAADLISKTMPEIGSCECMPHAAY